MELELKNKVAIVGGASKGLGRACAQVLADEGVKLVMCSRNQSDLERAAQEIRNIPPQRFSFSPEISNSTTPSGH